ncbi:hypothetical protein FRC07_007585 [Ceratobasidium sp. 392]|nr:hypothetical protein FRC07_007585 [Ceratobasidium sp. 392]
MWRAFVCAVLAAVTLQWTDVFATGKLVLFQVTAGAPWRGFELVPWMFLSVFGGLAGALLIRLNIAAALYRHHSWIREWPLMEVVCVTAFTALFSYPIAFMRAQSSELVAYLFQECDPTKPDYHGLCNPSSLWQNIFHLLLTCGLKVVLTAWTFGMKVPAGIFLPTIAIGATMGRAVGIIMQGWHRAHPTAWIFTACAPEGECISPGFYSVIGAAAMLGGVTRMTISLVVIMFELTGALSHVLPIMIAVMVSKWVGDVFGKEGIYDAWIALHGYPFLSTTVDYRDQGETAASRMTRKEHIVSIGAHHNTVEELEHMLNSHSFEGFPVVNGEQLIGYITRDRLQQAIDNLRQQYPDESMLSDVNCTFVGRHDTSYEEADLSSSIDPAPMQLRPGMPLQLVVSLFQKMSPQCVLFTSKGFLKGMMTKRDVVNLMREHFEEVHALSERPETIFDMTGMTPTERIMSTTPIPDPFQSTPRLSPANEIVVQGINHPSLFLPIPATDPLNALLSKYIPLEARPQRDLVGRYEEQTLDALVMSNSWRALARMAKDQIVGSPESDTVMILDLWSLRLSSLARMRLFNQATAECSNLYSVLGTVSPPSALRRIVPYELDVLHARAMYWAGDIRGYLDELVRLTRMCKRATRAGGGVKAAVGSVWAERGVRTGMLIVTQLVELQDYVGALSILRPLADSPNASPELVFALARIMMESGDSGSAHALSTRVTASPNADEVTQALTRALEAAMLGRWEEAEEVLRKALQVEKDNAVVSIVGWASDDVTL